MHIPCLAAGGGGQEVAKSSSELFLVRDPNAAHQSTGCKKISTEAPAICDGTGKSFSGLKRRRLDCGYTDLCDEGVLSLVASHTNWNPFFICLLSSLCKKTRAIADRRLWREFCQSRAPRMVLDLLVGAKNKQIDGGWQALGKLFLYCAGCEKCSSGLRFPMQEVAGHFVQKTRFSRTSGRFFLTPPCRSDILYMSDPCEHGNSPEDVGLFRGVFRSFDKSETKKLLTSRRVPLSEDEECPYCKAGVWNMNCARMIPKSASIRLAAYNEIVEYSICLNGHVNGRCALLHLSESDGSDEDA